MHLSLEASHILAERFDLWVVSQCGLTRARQTRDWLDKHKYPIQPDRQIYVPFSEQKWPHLKRLGAKFFVDDRMKHCEPAIRYVPTLNAVYWFGHNVPVAIPKIVAAPDWMSVMWHLGLDRVLHQRVRKP